MSSPKPFPLFRLPLITLRKVIRQLNVFETVDLYIACRKSDILKSFVLKPHILFVSNDGKDAWIVFNRYKEFYFLMKELVNNNYDRRRRIKKRLKKEKTCELECRKQSDWDDKEMTMYWSNKWKGTIEWTEMLIELYQIPAICVCFFEEFNVPQFMREWIIKEQPTRRDLCFENIKWNRESLQFLKNIDPRDDVYILFSFEMSDECPFDLTLTANHFNGIDTLLLKMDNIFQLDCKTIALSYSFFRDRDLTSFVRNWLNGGNPRLKVFSIERNSERFAEDPSTILERLECNYKVFSNPKTFQVKSSLNEPLGKRDLKIGLCGPPREVFVERGVDVHRSDGATLTISRKPDNSYWFIVSQP